MIEFTPKDGSGKRILTGDEIREMLRNAPRNEPVRRFDDVETYTHRTAEPVRQCAPDVVNHWTDLKPGEVVYLNGADPEDWYFVVDAGGRMTTFPLVKSGRRQLPRLRSVAISVTVAALAGFIAAGFL